MTNMTPRSSNNKKGRRNSSANVERNGQDSKRGAELTLRFGAPLASYAGPSMSRTEKAMATSNQLPRNLKQQSHRQITDTDILLMETGENEDEQAREYNRLQADHRRKKMMEEENAAVTKAIASLRFGGRPSATPGPSYGQQDDRSNERDRGRNLIEQGLRLLRMPEGDIADVINYIAEILANREADEQVLDARFNSFRRFRF